MRHSLLWILLTVNCLCISNPMGVAAQVGSEPPQVVSSVVPKITPLIRRSRYTDYVAVDVVVNAQGKVEFVQGLVGNSIFAKQSVIEAVKQWQFNESNQTDKTRSVILHFNFKPVPSAVPEEALRPNFKTPYALEIPYKLSPRLYLTPETYADRHALTDKWCQVHRTRLRKDLVEILYGLIGENRQYQKARARFFPHEATWVGGGCVIEIVSLEYKGGFRETIKPPDYAEVEYCSQCRAASARWLKSNPPPSLVPRHKPMRSSR